MKQITIYSRQSCGPCHQLKQFLNHKGYEYVEKSVDNPKYAEEAFNHSGMSVVPVTVIDDKVITGYNLGAIVPALT